MYGERLYRDGLLQIPADTQFSDTREYSEDLSRFPMVPKQKNQSQKPRNLITMDFLLETTISLCKSTYIELNGIHWFRPNGGRVRYSSLTGRRLPVTRIYNTWTSQTYTLGSLNLIKIGPLYFFYIFNYFILDLYIQLLSLRED